MPEITRLSLPVLDMAYAGSDMVHELVHAGEDLLSIRCFQFQSLHKVKWFVDVLAEVQKIGQHRCTASSIAFEAHFAEEEAVMPGGVTGKDIAAQGLVNFMVGSFGLAI